MPQTRATLGLALCLLTACQYDSDPMGLQTESPLEPPRFSIVASLSLPGSFSDTFTVSATDDLDDGSCDAAHCSLREAINAANANPGTDLIEFALGPPPADPNAIYTISLLTPLATITDPVAIDGSSQPGFTTVPVLRPSVKIDCRVGMSTGGYLGLAVKAGSSTIQGLWFQNCSTAVALLGLGEGGNRVRANRLLDAGYSSGFSIGSSDNTVGGDGPDEGNLITGRGNAIWIGGEAHRNVIQGNVISVLYPGAGIDVEPVYGSGVHIPNETVIGGVTPGARNKIVSAAPGIRFVGKDAIIQGNWIGLGTEGAAGGYIREQGIYVAGGSGLDGGVVLIGGDVPGAGNVISNVVGPGIYLNRNGVQVQGNLIGTDHTGTLSLPDSIGIDIHSSGNLIGGTTAGARNVVSGNRLGIRLQSASHDNVIQGNYIGPDITGSTAVPDKFDQTKRAQGTGISVEGYNNLIGGTGSGAGNVVSGNYAGIALRGITGGHRVEGNLIGTAASGTAPVGNSYGVVTSGSPGSVVGGTDPGAGNLIAYNDQDGIIALSGTISNSFLHNSIHSNGGLGISLLYGANPDHGVAYPTTATLQAGTLTVSGLAYGMSNTRMVIELFSSPSCDPSGNGEGKTFETAVEVRTDDSYSGHGQAPFSVAAPSTATPGDVVTATATDSAGNTWGFSTCVAIPVSNLPPIAGGGGPYVGVEGNPVHFDGSGSSDPDGDQLVYSWDFGDGSLSAAISPDHTYADNGEYVVSLTVTDPSGAFDSQSTTATIANVAPTVDPLVASADLVAVQTSVSATAAFNDPGVLDTHTASVDWGDGTIAAAVLTESGGSGSASSGHVYATSGVFTPIITVTDNDGASQQVTGDYIVVYDVDGGFVTGGGWFDSPPGAYKPDPGLTGMAQFGFVSRYSNGATVPSGNTEFQFRTGALDFQSSSYDFLVVTQGGHTAQIHGSGTVKGAVAPNGTDYLFMIWAADASPDCFRIRIWYEDATTTEHEVYDNGFAQPIGGGSIVIQAR